MKRLSDRDVELTDAEMKVHAHFQRLLNGHGIPFASALALNQMHKTTGEYPSDEFIEYLSDGCCERWGKYSGRVRIIPKWKRKPIEAGEGS